MAKSISLESKKAYARKSRSGNYIASLRLEGVKFSSKGTPPSHQSKAQVIAKYKKASDKA